MKFSSKREIFKLFLYIFIYYIRIQKSDTTHSLPFYSHYSADYKQITFTLRFYQKNFTSEIYTESSKFPIEGAMRCVEMGEVWWRDARSAVTDG